MNQALRPPMTRRQKLFFALDPKGKGLEIGASFNPVAPKAEGFDVEVLDHMDREGLLRKYPSKSPERIEEVDYVWSGQPFAELIGETERYDWIVASHVIEHTPNLIDFLNDCASILKLSGVLALAVPDKRFCFDRFRPLTGIGAVIDAHLAGRRAPSPGTVAESLLYNVFNGERHSWCLNDTREFRLRFTAAQAKGAMGSAHKRYMDCHTWCFSPSSFRLLVADLNALELITLRECCFFPTEPHNGEFVISLSKTGPGAVLGREEMLREVDTEMRILLNASG